MALSDRYTRVLFQSSAANLAAARRGRLRLVDVRQQFRKAAEGSTPGLSSPVMISPEMHQKLDELGYEANDIKKMTPDVAQEILDSGVTKRKQEQAAARREKLFDALEEKVVEDLDALKKRLDFAKTRLERAQEQVESLDASLADVEEARGSATDPAEQEKLRKKSEWMQTHIDRAEQAESSIRREMEALDKLVSAITKTEDGLIEELQEANDAAVITPGTKDDEIVEQLMKNKLLELEEISKLRQRLFGVQKLLDKKLEKLMRLHKDIAKQVDRFTVLPGAMHQLNTLRGTADSLQQEVDSTEKEQRSIIKEILRHEDKLRDVQTERRLQELDDALKDIPDIEDVREQAKEQIQQEDLGKDIASKPQRYKKRADEMLAYVDQVSQLYGDFILSYLAPDIPSDPQIEAFIRTANAAILKRAQEAQKLAAPYSRNSMHRSAILLIPSLYEFMATTMNGVVSQETKEARTNLYEARALQADLIGAGLVKEAIDFQQMGQGLGEAARWTKEKGKQIGKGVSTLIERGQTALDRRKFQKEDEGPRRDSADLLKKQQLALSQLTEVEHGLKEQLDAAQKLQDRFQKEGDQESAKEARNTILRLQDQLKSVGERKDVLNKGLAHKPEPGVLKGQEQAARRPKSDFEQAIRLLGTGTPKLVSLVKEGIPSDEFLEKELLRQSDRIAEAARRMIQESFKAKKKYPNLPPTIQAYGHMFLAIDDALHKALRAEVQAA